MGGGIGMGNTCKPMAVLFQCMTKFTTNKKKKKKRDKKKNSGTNAMCSTTIKHHDGLGGAVGDKSEIGIN